MRYHPLALTLPLSALLLASAAASPHSSSPARTAATLPPASFTYDFCNEGSSLCWRDPSDGGAGTFVSNSAASSSNSEDWAFLQDDSADRCHGTVTATCPGGWLSANLRGAEITLFRNKATGLCSGVNASSSWDAVMRVCNSPSASEPSTDFVVTAASCGGNNATEIFSWQWNGSHNSGGILVSVNHPNSNLFATSSPPACNNALWFQISS
jgi:hypothetical protein